jgi:hypothetical protein
VNWSPEYHGFCVLLIPALIPTHCSTIGSALLSFYSLPPSRLVGAYRRCTHAVLFSTHTVCCVLYVEARCSMISVCCSFLLYQTALGCMEVGATILVPRHCQSAKYPSRLSAHGCKGAHAQLAVPWALGKVGSARCGHGLGCSSAPAACAGTCTARR